MRDLYSFRAKELLGRKKVNRGDVILTSVPFAYVIDQSHRGQYCDNCLVSSENKCLQPCSNCAFVYYCSEYCEMAGGEVHSCECSALKIMFPSSPPNFARLLLRLIFRLKNGGDKFAEFYTEKKSRKFKDLMNHYRDIREDEERMADVDDIFKVLKSMVGEDNLPYESDFIGVYGRALVNRFCLLDGRMCSIGSAIYLAGSIFDHSCSPNAYPSFKGKTIEIRSLVDWSELDYNKVFISYIDLMKTATQRRCDLKESWYFWCECSLCLDKDRAMMENCIKCDNPDCGEPVLVPEKPESKFMHAPVPRPECSNCGLPVNETILTEYQSVVAFTRQRLKGMREESPSMETCLAILEKQGKKLSPWNVWRVRTLDFTLNAAYTNGIYGLVLQYGKNNFDAMKYYYGGEHPTFGMFLMKFGKSLLYLKEYREGLKYVEEAEKILIAAIGVKHPLVSDEIARLKMMANEDLEILMERRIAEKEANEHELVCKHCGRRKNLNAKTENNLSSDNRVLKIDKNKKLNFDSVSDNDDIDKEYTSKPLKSEEKDYKWSQVANGILTGTEKKKPLPYDPPALDDKMSNYLTGTEGVKKNKYAMKETNKVWEKLLSEAEIRWARYVAETEFNNELANQDSSSDEDEDKLVINGIKEHSSSPSEEPAAEEEKDEKSVIPKKKMSTATSNSKKLSTDTEKFVNGKN